MVNLLEVICYHAHALKAAKDSTLDLVDYCARRLSALGISASQGAPVATTTTTAQVGVGGRDDMACVRSWRL